MSMTIGEVLEVIKDAPDDHCVYFEFGGVHPTSVHSWRGIYAEAAIGFSDGKYGNGYVTVADFRKELLLAIDGHYYQGWKGGDYRYTEETPLHVDNPGCYTNTEITKIVVGTYDVRIHTEREES